MVYIGGHFGTKTLLMKLKLEEEVVEIFLIQNSVSILAILFLLVLEI